MNDFGDRAPMSRRDFLNKGVELAKIGGGVLVGAAAAKALGEKQQATQPTNINTETAIVNGMKVMTKDELIKQLRLENKEPLIDTKVILYTRSSWGDENDKDISNEGLFTFFRYSTNNAKDIIIADLDVEVFNKANFNRGIVILCTADRTPPGKFPGTVATISKEQVVAAYNRQNQTGENNHSLTLIFHGGALDGGLDAYANVVDWRHNRAKMPVMPYVFITGELGETPRAIGIDVQSAPIGVELFRDNDSMNLPKKPVQFLVSQSVNGSVKIS